MKIKIVSLTPEIRDVLVRSTFDARTVTLPPDLDRALYVSVDKVLKAAGGKWNRKAGAHVFDLDPRETIALNGDGVVNRQQTFQQFWTPPALATRMVDFADFDDVDGVDMLEPSAGAGALCTAALATGRVEILWTVEIDPVAYDVLRWARTEALKSHPDLLWHNENQDFLATPRLGFKPNRIVMNPPFNGNQAKTHIQEAFARLSKDGVLVSLVQRNICEGSTKADKAFAEFVEMYGEIAEYVPRGTFKDTQIETAILRLVK